MLLLVIPDQTSASVELLYMSRHTECSTKLEAALQLHKDAKVAMALTIVRPVIFLAQVAIVGSIAISRLGSDFDIFSIHRSGLYGICFNLHADM